MRPFTGCPPWYRALYSPPTMELLCILLLSLSLNHKMFVRSVDAQELESLASQAVSLVTGVSSEVVSMYTELTSILADTSSADPTTAPASTSAEATSSPSTTDTWWTQSTWTPTDAPSLLTTSTPSSTTTTPSSTTSSLSSRPSSTLSRSTSSSPSSSESTQLAASSGSSTPSPSKSDHGSNNTVAIVVGSLLGAIVLLLIILCALLFLRRRRRRRARNQITPTNAEVESWRLNPDGTAYDPAGHRADGVSTPIYDRETAMAEQSRSMHNRHQNPFVPVPPPPRRSAPNSRPGLTDGPFFGQRSYESVPKRSTPIHPANHGNSVSPPEEYHDHHLGRDAAIGAGGAALGAAAMKRHNHKQNSYKAPRKNSFEVQGDTAYRPRRQSVQRKPVPRPPPLRTSDPSPEAAALLSKSSSVYSDDHHKPGYKSPVVSPLSPDPVELPERPFNDRPAMAHRRPSQEALLGDNNGPTRPTAAGLFAVAAAANRRNHGGENNGRPQVHRDDSYKLQMPTEDQVKNNNRRSGEYDTYHPPTASHHDSGVSQVMPPPAALGAVHRHRRSDTPPDIPARSPARASFSKSHTPPSGSSNESLTTTNGNRSRALQALQGDPGQQLQQDSPGEREAEIPVMWRRSAENPRFTPKPGINYNDFQPVRRNNTPPTNSGSSSANTSQERGFQNQGGRRVSLNALIQDERRRMEGEKQRGRARHYTGPRGPENYDGSDYGVGQAL